MALKVGFVGVGGIAKRHMGHCSQRDDVEMVGYADVNLPIAQAVAEQYGGNAYSDCKDLYEEERPDAIVICTPPFAHGEIEEGAAERGIHFFVEKPVAVNLDLAMRVKKAVDGSDIIAQVGYMMRFSEATKKVTELLADRPIAMVQAHYYMPGMPAKGWWAKMDLGGGQLVEQATHMLDLGRFLAGDVISVSGRTARAHDWTPPADAEQVTGGLTKFADGLDIPDTTALTMEYESGALGSLSCSMVPQAKWDNGFRVVADGLLVAIDGACASWAGDEEGKMASAQDWPNYVLAEFLECVKSGAKPSVPYDEGIKSLAISAAGYASVEKGGMPVDPRELLREAGFSE